MKNCIKTTQTVKDLGEVVVKIEPDKKEPVDFSEFHDWEESAKQLYKLEQKHGWKTLFYIMLRYQRKLHKDSGYNFGDSVR